MTDNTSKVPNATGWWLRLSTREWLCVIVERDGDDALRWRWRDGQPWFPVRSADGSWGGRLYTESEHTEAVRLAEERVTEDFACAAECVGAPAHGPDDGRRTYSEFLRDGITAQAAALRAELEATKAETNEWRLAFAKVVREHQGAGKVPPIHGETSRPADVWAYLGGVLLDLRRTGRDLAEAMTEVGDANELVAKADADLAAARARIATNNRDLAEALGLDEDANDEDIARAVVLMCECNEAARARIAELEAAERGEKMWRDWALMLLAADGALLTDGEMASMVADRLARMKAERDEARVGWLRETWRAEADAGGFATPVRERAVATYGTEWADEHFPEGT